MFFIKYQYIISFQIIFIQQVLTQILIVSDDKINIDNNNFKVTDFTQLDNIFQSPEKFTQYNNIVLDFPSYKGNVSSTQQSLHDLIAYNPQKLNLSFVVSQDTKSVCSLLQYYYNFKFAVADIQETPFSSYYEGNYTLKTKNALYIINEPQYGLYQQVPLTFASFSRNFFEVSSAFINSRFLQDKAVFDSFTAIVGTELQYQDNQTQQFLQNITEVVNKIKIRKLKLYKNDEKQKRGKEKIDDKQVQKVYDQLPEEIKQKMNVTQFRKLGLGFEQFLRHTKGEPDVEKPTVESLAEKLKNKIKKDEL